MSPPSEPGRSAIGSSEGTPEAAARLAGYGGADALPVLAQAPIVVRAGAPAGALSRAAGDGVIPVVQAAAVAAGGFVAGAAVVSLAHRRSRRSAALGKRRARRRRFGRGGGGRSAPAVGELIQIVGSRSLLVDVHLLGSR